MKTRTFLINFLIPVLMLFLISFSTSLISPGKGGTISGQGPGALPGKSNLKGNEYISREFRWDITNNKTIITGLKLPPSGLKKEMEKFGVNLKMKNPSYFLNRGFLNTRQGLLINYRMVFMNSRSWFKKISNDILFSAEIKKEEDPIICFLKFVQTIKYKVPPKIFKGKFIMEFLPPLNCLYLKYGDCDTKSVLLAELLDGSSFRKEKLAVIVLKGFGIFHAILAVERAPLPGMLFFYIDRMGPFIPLETTDKGWMPGFSNKQVVQCLQNGQFQFVKLY